MTLHPRTGWGNRTFPSVHWRLVFQGQEMDNIVWPGQYFTHQLHHFIRKKKHFGRSPADQGTLSKVHGWIGQWQNSRNRPLQHHCGHITLGWNWVMGDQHGVCETGVLSNQLHKAWEVRRGKAAVPPKTASFRSCAQQHSSAVLQRSFLINISQDYSSLPRVTKGACAFVWGHIGNANLPHSSLSKIRWSAVALILPNFTKYSTKLHRTIVTALPPLFSFKRRVWLH